MSDFLTNLAQRALGIASPLSPLVASLYAPVEPAAGMDDLLGQPEPRKSLPRTRGPVVRPRAAALPIAAPRSAASSELMPSPVSEQRPAAVSEQRPAAVKAEPGRVVGRSEASQDLAAPATVESERPAVAEVPLAAVAAAPIAATPLMLSEEAPLPAVQVGRPASGVEQAAEPVQSPLLSEHTNTTPRVPGSPPNRAAVLDGPDPSPAPRERQGEGKSSTGGVGRFARPALTLPLPRAGSTPDAAAVLDGPDSSPAPREREGEGKSSTGGVGLFARPALTLPLPQAGEGSERSSEQELELDGLVKVSSPSVRPARSAAEAKTAASDDAFESMPIRSVRDIEHPAPQIEPELPWRELPMAKQLAIAIMKQLPARAQKSMSGDAEPVLPQASAAADAIPSRPSALVEQAPAGAPAVAAPPAAPAAPASVKINIGRIELRAPPPPAAPPARRLPPLSLAAFLKSRQGAR